VCCALFPFATRAVMEEVYELCQLYQGIHGNPVNVIYF